jgi:hypothetical protein
MKKKNLQIRPKLQIFGMGAASYAQSGQQASG